MYHCYNERVRIQAQVVEGSKKSCGTQQHPIHHHSWSVLNNHSLRERPYEHYQEDKASTIVLNSQEKEGKNMIMGILDWWWVSNNDLYWDHNFQFYFDCNI